MLDTAKNVLTRHQKATGPLSFATYMQLCLSHPVHGYYMNPSNPVFGTRGDFTTSPEISQVFGEVVRQFPPVRDKLDSVHLVETSPAMCDLQCTTLETAWPHDRVQFAWHDALDQVNRRDDRFTMLVAHEFFDALPVHVIEKTVQGWHEVLIALANDSSIRYTHPSSAASTVLVPPTSTPRFTTSGPASSPSAPLQPLSPRWTRVLSPTPTASSTLLGHASSRFASLPIGARVEVSGASIKLARQIAELLAPASAAGSEDGGSGCALVVDYGAEKAVGNSLRGFKDHAIVDVLHRPGECDVTANVDFALLKEVVSDLVTPHGTLSQGTFLTEVGVQLRADRLIKAASTQERKSGIAECVNRLVDPLGMGGQYAVLGITGTPKGEAVWPFLPVHNGSK
ncbi:S-adenosyl-L-methionine-dependent methyltransferase [Chiua virens]|nr:S-adenosyl-L-methionine-dependent methyltransferase [Chiua virens]